MKKFCKVMVGLMALPFIAPLMLMDALEDLERAHMNAHAHKVADQLTRIKIRVPSF